MPDSAGFLAADLDEGTLANGETTTPGPPMTLGNMRELGVQHLIAFCLNDACRHQALIDVSSYPAETEVPSFKRRAALHTQASIFSNPYCAWCAASPRA